MDADPRPENDDRDELDDVDFETPPEPQFGTADYVGTFLILVSVTFLVQGIIPWYKMQRLPMAADRFVEDAIPVISALMAGAVCGLCAGIAFCRRRLGIAFLFLAMAWAIFAAVMPDR